MKRIKLRYFYIGDLSILIIVIGIILFISVRSLSGQSQAPKLVIRRDTSEWQYTLDTDMTIQIPGKIGTDEIVIRDGLVFIGDTPCGCALKICVASGSISKPGDWIICLPNRLFLSIEGRLPDSSLVDAVAF
ncbi:MAG: NusG domain II-containing protein [Spirochaetales bacterium]|nr:NusG domain II-containing protein [Spirochaetales bacterium]